MNATEKSRDLDGRSIVVTGGSRGLGREMALALVEAGASVLVTGSARGESLDAALADLSEAAGGSDRVVAVAADVVDASASEAAIAQAVRAFGRVDALVNNAGIGMRVVSETFNTEPTRFWETDPVAWRAIIDTNLTGAFLAARAAARAMVAQGHGKIVNISTSAGTMVRRGYSPYGPSKAALEAASRIWAQDLEGTGVTVNVYLPGGASDTGLIPGGAGRTGADGNLLPASIMRRGICWLCGPGSDGVTGARFIARDWDPELPPDEAARKARSAPAELPAIL